MSLFKLINPLTLWLTPAIFLLWSGSAVKVSAQITDIEKRVATLFVEKCLECHSGATLKGGLDLSSRQTALQGGESGPALERDEPDSSLLLMRVLDGEMPPKKPLNDAEKALIQDWVNQGFPWPEEKLDPFQYTTDTRGGFDWWAFQPIPSHFPQIPKSENPIDYFIDRQLKAQGLKANGPATSRDLIRRLSMDLIGLPADQSLIESYEKNPNAETFSLIVKELLKNPGYGQRWARHWLDVVRYGESTGFERNAPNFTIWPYRDWVIKAWNDDMPYDEFARKQIAGDLFDPGPEGAAAAGFMVAGVHNTVIGVSQRMRLLARQDELEENIGILGQTFLGLTVQCARCHDHKFDPISNGEYYGLISAIDGVQHGERSFPDPKVAERLKNLEIELKAIDSQLSQWDQQVREQAKAKGLVSASTSKELPKPYAMWTFDSGLSDELSGLEGQLSGNARLEGGALILDGKTGYFRTATLKKNFGPKTFEAWVMTENLDQRGGGVISLESGDGSIFDAIVFGEQEPRKWMAGSDGFSRTVSFQGPSEDQANLRPVHIAIVYEKDGTVTCYRDGLPYGIPVKTNPVKYPLNDVHIAIGLRHLPAGGNKHFEGKILRAAIYDRPLAAVEVLKSASREEGFLSEEVYQKLLTNNEFKQRQELRQKSDKLHQERSSALKNAMTKIYTVSARPNPGPMAIHLRGDVTEFGAVVPPDGLRAVKAGYDWDLSETSTDRQRRLQLARWITSSENPLFARVIVNRLWHYHFGTGIVDTPNDFGFNGGRPSHPELLDYLARFLITNGMKLKPLHELIVTSRAYQRSSESNAVNIEMDSSNRLLWRHSPKRLEGEVLRDSMLKISGLLNPHMGGAGYLDVEVKENNGTTYYEPIDQPQPEFQRRTIYRFSPRGGRSTLLDTFDCPDASTTSPRRNVTTTPLQALSLLHGAFSVRVSEALAQQIQSQMTDKTAVERVRQSWRQILFREPSDFELDQSMALEKEHGLWAVCLALFNTNEFVIVP